MDLLWVPLHSDYLLRLFNKDNSGCQTRRSISAFTYILVSGARGSTGSSLSQTPCWEMSARALTPMLTIYFVRDQDHLSPLSPGLPPYPPLGPIPCSLGTHSHFLLKQSASIKPSLFKHNYNSRFITPSGLLRLELSTDMQTG